MVNRNTSSVNKMNVKSIGQLRNEIADFEHLLLTRKHKSSK